MGGSACLIASDAACSARPLLAASSTPAPCAARAHAERAACRRSGLVATWEHAGSTKGLVGRRRQLGVAGDAARTLSTRPRRSDAAARRAGPQQARRGRQRAALPSVRAGHARGGRPARALRGSSLWPRQTSRRSARVPSHFDALRRMASSASASSAAAHGRPTPPPWRPGAAASAPRASRAPPCPKLRCQVQERGSPRAATLTT